MGSHAPRGNRRSMGGPLRPVFESTGSHNQKPDYKTAALCKQVARALALALAGECADPLLQSLQVDEVLPAPNAGRLLVRLRAPNASPLEILPRLEHVRGLLRASIAASIARKRTPELLFAIIPALPTHEEVPHE
jgi:ribosome-binding factor A